jgi:hypothetical protein
LPVLSRFDEEDLMRRFARAFLAAGLLVIPGVAQAQEVPLSQFLPRYFTPSNPLVLKDTGHSAHFAVQSEATESLNILNRNIAYQLASFPLGSSSGGFTFTLDPAAGVLTRSAESFGPLFAERGLTAGKGKLTLGANYTHSTFDRFEGRDLDDGSIRLILTHNDLDGSGDTLTPFFEGDIIDANLFLKLTTDTVAAFANYGITDRFDVGVAVPFVKVKMDSRFHTTLRRLATEGDFFLFHIFENDTLEADNVETGDASGIGDIVVRGKLNLAHQDAGDLAAAVDVRLPTGDDENLLGAGAVQAKFFLVASGSAKKAFSPHLNLGYTFTGESDTLGKLPDELNYAVGFDAAVGSKVTVTGDFVGRSLLDATRVVEGERTFRFNRRPPAPVQTITDTVLLTETGTMNLLLGSAGVKFNPGGRLLFSANLLFSLSKDNGLQDTITPVFAIDYNF